jgi:hypothetical protein
VLVGAKKQEEEAQGRPQLQQELACLRAMHPQAQIPRESLCHKASQQIQ